MDGISLQQFLQARSSASTRMQESTNAQSASATKTSATDWQSVLEAKRREQGMPTAPSTTPASAPNRANSAYVTTTSIPSTDYKARAEQMKGQLAQGIPVRTIGSLLDMRA
jgi:hypothetical protein